MTAENKTQDSAAGWDHFLDAALRSKEPIVTNAQMPVRVLEVAGHRMPVTLNRTNSAVTSWVASLSNAYGPYARAEMELVGMPRLQRPLYGAASVLAEQLLNVSGLKGGAFLNNWFLATNLHPQKLHWTDVLWAVKALTKEESDLPVILRSLTPLLHLDLLKKLSEIGFLLIPTRQVWVAAHVTADAWLKHSDVRKDIALERRTSNDFDWVPAEVFADTDYAQAVRLYDALYRGKYPQFNPAYTESFFRLGASTGFMNLKGLRRRSTGELCGLVGIINRDGVYATPVLGYDLNADPKEGLYRKLMLQAFMETRNNGGVLHCSGGAGSFKKQRGAHHYVEFAAVWAEHLPMYRRASLRALHQIVQKVAVPYLESREL
jgi:hypothetical protein